MNTLRTVCNAVTLRVLDWDCCNFTKIQWHGYSTLWKYSRETWTGGICRV